MWGCGSCSWNVKSHLYCILSDTFAPIFLIDVDECALPKGPCEQLCTNTEGSFQCYCHSGFQLHMDGLKCVGMYSGASCLPTRLLTIWLMVPCGLE